MADLLVWIDCEMTGLDLGKDKLIEVAALVTDPELNVLGEGVDLVIHADESISVVEGHLRIEVEGGDSYDLTAGCAAAFNKGARTRWEVLAPTVEFFVYS